MSNRILQGWVGRGTCWLIIFEILSVTIAIPLQVLLSSASPPSNGFWFEHHHRWCNYLTRTTNKTREQSTTNQERPQIKRQQRTGRANKHQKNTKGKWLSPRGGSPRLGLERNKSGCLLSTSLSHSLASTSQADHVSLYDCSNNGLDPSST